MTTGPWDRKCYFEMAKFIKDAYMDCDGDKCSSLRFGSLLQSGRAKMWWGIWGGKNDNVKQRTRTAGVNPQDCVDKGQTCHESNYNSDAKCNQADSNRPKYISSRAHIKCRVPPCTEEDCCEPSESL